MSKLNFNNNQLSFVTKADIEDQILNSSQELIMLGTTAFGISWNNKGLKEELFNKVWEDIKENVNHKMPAYKYIREIILSKTPLIKTTTQKVKRHEELKLILGEA